MLPYLQMNIFDVSSRCDTLLEGFQAYRTQNGILIQARDVIVDRVQGELIWILLQI